jgi:hypothetical protein
MHATELLHGLSAGPAIQLLHFDFPRSRALLVQLDRAQLTQASFLDDRLLAGAVPRQWRGHQGSGRFITAPRGSPAAAFHLPYRACRLDAALPA